MSKEETVEVTIRIPKGIISFLKEMGEDVQEYLEYSIVQAVGADIDVLDGGPFGARLQWPEDAKAVIKRHGLNEVLKVTSAQMHC